MPFMPRESSLETGGARAPLREDAPRDPGWPHRRGPNHDAVSAETELAESWPPQGPPVLWMREIGVGYSGFVAVEDCVFTQSQSLSEQMILCLDADNGEEIWRRRYDWPHDPAGMYPGPRATPTWYGGCVYYAGPKGRVGCLDAVDGRPIWQVNVNDKFGGRGTDFGYCCSPTIEDDLVVMPVGGRGASMVALDAFDGTTVWQSGDEPASYCSAIPITVAGRRHVVGFLQNAIGLFDLKTGRIAWQEKCSQGYDEHASAPLYEEPFLMVASPFRKGAECYRLEAGAAEDTPSLKVESQWFSRQMSHDTASGVVCEGHVYGFDLRDVQAKAHRPSRGTFKCMELATGKVVWESELPGHSTVLLADGKLYLFNDQGELILARASPSGYEELARTEVFSGEICWTAPALHRGRLYLRSPSKAACIYVGKPENLGKKQREEAVATSQLPRTRRFDLLAFVGGERPYAQDQPDLPELTRWYSYSILGVLAPAALLGMLTGLIVRTRRPTAGNFAGRIAFWIAAFLLGALGTSIYNRIAGPFVFTWPVCLAVAHQVAINAVAWSSKAPRPRGARWLPLVAMVLFIAVCIIYFVVCRKLNHAVMWIFLMGFLPSWAVAMPGAYRMRLPGRPLRDFLWAAASFTLFYWSATVVMWVNMAVR